MGYRCPQRVDQRNDRVGTADGGATELRHVELVDPAVTGDGVGGRLRDEAEPRFRAG